MAAQITDYEFYLRVPELLALQKTADELACPDELLFQIIHQSAELWMKLIDHELTGLGGMLDRAELVPALTTLRRVHHIQRQLLSSMELLYTLTPVDYMNIRAVLGRGSGQESPGFRRLLAVGGELWPHFQALLDRRQVTLIELYREPDRHADLYAIAEGLVEFDIRLQEWRNRHILVVYRTIGIGTPSLKGKHSELLERGLRTQFFPALWEVRDSLYGEWSAAHPSGAYEALSPGSAPGRSPSKPQL